MRLSLPILGLHALAAKWRAIALVAIAFARMVRRYEDSHRPGTYEQAKHVQLILRSAHIMVMSDISEALETCPPKDDAEKHALDHLRLIALALLALSLVIEDVLTRNLRSFLCWQNRKYDEDFLSLRETGGAFAIKTVYLDPG